MIEAAPYALGLTTVSLIYFFYLGFRESHRTQTDDSFWLADRSMSGDLLSTTWSISTVSFAAGVLYYMQIVSMWGFWVFIGSLLTYAIGQGIALYLATKKDSNINGFHTVGAFVEERSGSRWTGRMVDYLNFASAWALVYIELGLVVKVFSYLLDTPSFAFELTSIIILCLVVYSYISLGGFPAIVASDKWQSWLVWAATVSILFASLLMDYDKASGLELSFDFSPTVETRDIIVYLIFALIANFTLSIAQATIWQRLAATDAKANRWKDGLKGIGIAFILYSSYVVVAGLYRGDNVSVSSQADIFDPIIALGDIGIQMLFPIVFCGFISAMISTADSSAMAGIYSIFGVRDYEDETEWPIIKRKTRIIFGSSLGAVVIAFTLFETVGSGYFGTFLAVIFYLFSILTIAAPVVTACIVAPSRLRSGNVLVLSLIIGLLVVTLGAFTELFGTGLTGNLVATLISFVIIIPMTFKIHAA